jgi:hypothetical protein
VGGRHLFTEDVPTGADVEKKRILDAKNFGIPD